jgi:hypothetical protein
MGAIKTKAGGGGQPAFQCNNVTRDPTADAANDQAGADVFAGRAMRSLRKFAELRSQDAKPRRCLIELERAADAVGSTQWAIEYEQGLRARGER